MAPQKSSILLLLFFKIIIIIIITASRHHSMARSVVAEIRSSSTLVTFVRVENVQGQNFKNKASLPGHFFVECLSLTSVTIESVTQRIVMCFCTITANQL